MVLKGILGSGTRVNSKQIKELQQKKATWTLKKYNWVLKEFTDRTGTKEFSR